MKKYVVIAVTILFFLLLLGALLFKLLGSNSTPKTVPVQTNFPVSPSLGATEDQPDAFAKSFYIWYLRNAAQDPEFPHPENRQQVLKDWLTPGFIGDWDNIQVETEASPILLTADDYSKWGSGVTAAITSQLSYSSTVTVRVGPASEDHRFTVQLVRGEDGSWKINSINNAY